MSRETDCVIDEIIRIRKEKGISIVKLSVDSGVSRSHLFYIESKKSSPSLDTLDRIAKSLGVEMKDFFAQKSAYTIQGFSGFGALAAEDTPEYQK